MTSRDDNLAIDHIEPERGSVIAIDLDGFPIVYDHDHDADAPLGAWNLYCPKCPDEPPDRQETDTDEVVS